MTQHNLGQAKQDLTLLLLYLNRFEEKMGPYTITQSWKGYDFADLNELTEKEYLGYTKHPRRSKSISLTEEGIAKAKELMTKYGLDSELD